MKTIWVSARVLAATALLAGRPARAVGMSFDGGRADGSLSTVLQAGARQAPAGDQAMIEELAALMLAKSPFIAMSATEAYLAGAARAIDEMHNDGGDLDGASDRPSGYRSYALLRGQDINGKSRFSIPAAGELLIYQSALGPVILGEEQIRRALIAAAQAKEEAKRPAQGVIESELAAILLAKSPLPSKAGQIGAVYLYFGDLYCEWSDGAGGPSYQELLLKNSAFDGSRFSAPRDVLIYRTALGPVGVSREQIKDALSTALAERAAGGH